MAEMKKKAKAEEKATGKTKTVANKKAYGIGRGRRVGAKCKKTRLKREMAKERIEEQGFEREEGLVCMGDRCVCHRLAHKNNGAQCRCAYKKEGAKCDAMF